jgi:voltage-gated potassium channel
VKTLGRALTDPTHEKYGTWQSLITFFILASCISLALETVPEIADKYHQEFFIMEWVSVGIFTIDYLANLFYSESKVKYAFSVWGIIDLISILPSYLMLLNLTALQGTKVLRLIRVARVLRVLKLVRTAVNESNASQNPIVANLKIYFILFFSVLMISSTAMYFVEGGLYSSEALEAGQKVITAAAEAGKEPEKFIPTDPLSGNPIPEDKRFFTSIPAAMWWCIVTMTSTGYGDMFPVTAGGRIVAGITMFLGLVLFGILLNVIGKTLMVVLFGEKMKADE